MLSVGSYGTSAPASEKQAMTMRFVRSVSSVLLGCLAVWISVSSAGTGGIDAFAVVSSPAARTHSLPSSTRTVVKHSYQKYSRSGTVTVSASATEDGNAPATLPTVEQLRNDAFMQQVQYGQELAFALRNGSVDNGLMQSSLAAQLSHSDGIRGFFVSYLTVVPDADDPDSDDADFDVPASLQEAMKQSNMNELIPLACMNVIMPTAMTTMHANAELQQQSSVTASRGSKVLAVLGNAGVDDATVKSNCEAILAVAKDTDGATSSDDERFKYWADFFDKWGYQEQQRKDIAESMETILKQIS